MKRSDPQSIRQIIDRVINAAGLSREMRLRQACDMWPRIVGPGIEARTLRRWADDKGVLHVNVDSAPLKQELSMQRSQIARAINEALGPGDDVITQIHIY